jgi:hypothetical protein
MKTSLGPCYRAAVEPQFSLGAIMPQGPGSGKPADVAVFPRGGTCKIE